MGVILVIAAHSGLTAHRPPWASLAQGGSPTRGPYGPQSNELIASSPQGPRSVSPSERMSYRPWVVWSVGPWDLGTAGAAPANGTNLER